MSVVRFQPRKNAQALVCVECGAHAEAACDCGANYVPAGERAAKAIEANPEKSDRAIAEEIGVGNATVSRARRATVPDDTVAKRTGRDGKRRSLPRPKPRLVTPEPLPIDIAVAALRNMINNSVGVVCKDIRNFKSAHLDLGQKHRRAIYEEIQAAVNELTGEINVW